MEATQNSSFFYRPLTSNSSIRLVELNPSTEPRICARLLHTSLQQFGVVYEALSYVWGDPTKTSSVLLNGQDFLVTSNLEAALKALQLPSKPRWLWVDAICINQSDLGERSQQVSIMKQIYQGCQRCLLWLGEATPEIERGMELARTIESINFHVDCVPSRENSISKEDFAALRALFLTPEVWKRVWVMQEVAVARDVILVAGSLELPWNVLDKFLERESPPDAFHKTFGHSGPPSAHSLRYPQVIHHQRLIEKDLEGRQAASLMDVIARFRPTKSTDPKDKLYALLGLATNTMGIVPDYRKSVAQVFLGFALAQINASGNLDLLCQSQWYFSTEETSLNLPSWVPDFSNSRFLPLIFAQRGIFRAGKPSCRTPCRVSDTGEISLSGIKVGSIATLKGFSSWQEHHRACSEGGGFGSLSALCVSWLPDDFPVLPHSKGTRLEQSYPLAFPPKDPLRDVSLLEHLSGFEAFWRTLIMDCTRYPTLRLSQSEVHDIGEAMGQWFVNHEDHRSFRISRDLGKICDRWRFTVLNNGLYSMVPSKTEPGDIIAVLDGAKVPVTLRPVFVKEEEGLPTLKYKFIGTAYVHGIMDGEANNWVETAAYDLKPEEFVLICE